MGHTIFLTPNLTSRNDAGHGIDQSELCQPDAMSSIVFYRDVWRQKAWVTNSDHYIMCRNFPQESVQLYSIIKCKVFCARKFVQKLFQKWHQLIPPYIGSVPIKDGQTPPPKTVIVFFYVSEPPDQFLKRNFCWYNFFSGTWKNFRKPEL